MTMVDTILWGLLIVIFVRSLYKSYRRSVVTRKKLLEMDSEKGFSDVDSDSFSEAENIMKFLYERESDLGIASDLMMNNQYSIMYEDLSAYKKKNHPRFIAFIRAAHMAGFSVSVRRKDRAEQERAANAGTGLPEYVTKIDE